MSSQTQEQSQSPWWNQSVVYWQANQVAITFHSPLDRAEGVEQIIASLRLNDLNQFLAAHGFQLRAFTLKDVPHPAEPSLNELEQLEAELEQLEAEVEALERVARNRTTITRHHTSDGQPYKTPAQRDLEELEARIELLEREIEQRERAARQHDNATPGDGVDGQEPPRRGLNSPVGKYLFAPASGQGTLAMCFFHSSNPSLAPSSSRHGNGKEGATTADTTKAVVKLINQNLDKLKQDGHIPLVSATPNWISGGAPDIGSSCPASEPIPVPEDHAHAQWHFTLPDLSDSLQALKGDGVTIFVLDTMPNKTQITKAAQRISNKNMLLQSVAAAMNNISPSIVIPTSKSIPARLNTIQTGKDIYGRHFGFKMADHGLFVTGILHDLVPNAKIECIRVLNDSGVGDLGMITDALQEIQQRMAKQEFKRVVVNLSMIIIAPDENLPDLWFADDTTHAEGLAAMIQDIDLLHAGLRMVIQSLVTQQKAVIVASAGNESDTSNFHGLSGGVPHRFGPRNPAAFPEVISVGAVNNEGLATTYSNYPSVLPNHNGVATYGGALPQPVPPQPDPLVKTHAIVKDAVVGLHSSSQYPTLSASETPPHEYSDDSHGWAYWSGTSFATPIVSSLAALLLQAEQKGDLPANTSVEELITTAHGQKLLTATHAAFSNHTGFGVDIGLLRAVQKGS
ncbi:MAG: S8 family serine peptidase [Ktedonobacteraceae bacterium]